MVFRNGLYDRLIYDDEVSALAGLTEQHRALLETPTAHQRREQFLDELIQCLPELLDAAAAGGVDAAEKARLEIEFIRRLLMTMRTQTSQPARKLAVRPQRLKSVHSPNTEVAYPGTGLRHPWLFTSAKSDPSLLRELRAELQSADRVDILVSFITWKCRSAETGAYAPWKMMSLWRSA